MVGEYSSIYIYIYIYIYIGATAIAIQDYFNIIHDTNYTCIVFSAWETHLLYFLNPTFKLWSAIYKFYIVNENHIKQMFPI